MAVSSLKEEPPLRTKLLVVAFAFVVFLPALQTGSTRTVPIRPTAYSVIAEAGPGAPSLLKRAPGQRQGNPDGNPARSHGGDSSFSAASGISMGVMALARSFLFWMGL